MSRVLYFRFFFLLLFFFFSDDLCLATMYEYKDSKLKSLAEQLCIWASLIFRKMSIILPIELCKNF